MAARGPSSTLEYQPPPAPPGRGLAALRHRDFRLFWFGQMISLMGTWMQVVAQNWLVLQLTQSPLILGAVSALQFLPILTLSVLGGVIADRLPRRQVLLGTQTSAMVLALVLAVLTQAGTVQIYQVMILALLLGTVNAVDMPTRQAFVVELVGRRDLRNAIALNSAAFNSARLIGPAAAGLAIGWVGIAGCFYINAASFLAVLAGLALISAGRRSPARTRERRPLREELQEGVVYVFTSPLLRLVVVLVAIVGTFGMNMNVLIPVLATESLRVGAFGYGFLSSSMGVGSLLAAIALASLSQAPRPRVLVASAGVFGLLQVLLALTYSFAASVILLAAMGFTMIFFTTLSNTTLQTATPNVLRGRVMSVYTTVFAGTTPLGSLFAGSVAEAMGANAGFFFGGLISVTAAGVGFFLVTVRERTEA